MNSRRNEEVRAECNSRLIWEAECVCGMTLLAPWVNVIDGKLPCLMCGAMANARPAQGDGETVQDVPTWLHCSHYPDGPGPFTKRAIYFNNPTTGEYTIPCVVCPECLFAALTPHTVCAGVGPDPMPDMPTFEPDKVTKEEEVAAVMIERAKDHAARGGKRGIYEGEILTTPVMLMADPAIGYVEGNVEIVPLGISLLYEQGFSFEEILDFISRKPTATSDSTNDQEAA